MTTRFRVLWVGLVAATATAAVFTTPTIIAGLTFNALDRRRLLASSAPGRAGHPLAVPAPKHTRRQVVALKGAEMTKRLRVLWVGLLAVTATAAVLTTPAIIAGITFNFVD
jgi:hypothetical protein